MFYVKTITEYRTEFFSTVPSCDCGRGIENVKHFLLLCKKYEAPRNELRKKVGGRNMRMENLLGDPKLVKDTLEYVEKTGRFNFV